MLSQTNLKVPNVFQNDSHLIMQELGKFCLEVSFISNGLEKYMSFSL